MTRKSSREPQACRVDGELAFAQTDGRGFPSQAPMIDVVSMKPMTGYTLRVAFCDGSFGVHDFSSTTTRKGRQCARSKSPRSSTRLRRAGGKHVVAEPPEPARGLVPSLNYARFEQAMRVRKPIICVYRGCRRELCHPRPLAR